MRRSLKWLVGAIVAGLLIMAIAIPAFAAGPNGGNSGTPNPTGQAGYGTCQGTGLGPDEAVTELLGMTAEEIQALRQDGQSLVQIAATKNVTEQKLIDAIMVDKKEALDKLVDAGTITEEQAELRLAQMEERVKLAVNRTETGRPAWSGANGNGQSGACNGTGMMRQGGFNGNPDNCTGTPGTGMGKMMRFNRTASN